MMVGYVEGMTMLVIFVVVGNDVEHRRYVVQHDDDGNW